MPYFKLRPDFIPVLLQKSLTRLQLFLIIPNCVGISDWSQHTEVVNAVLFDVKWITLLSWSVCKTVCYFHANSKHWFSLSETI